MSTAMVNYIAAKFGGEEIRFELKRSDIVALENTLGGSAFQTLKRFTANVWTMREVQIVLSAAIPEESADRDRNSAEALLASMHAQLLNTPGGSSYVTVLDSRRVLAVLRDNPPAVYAVLAQLVLEAALLGIDPTHATFDESAMEGAS